MMASLKRQQGLVGLPEYVPGLPIEEVQKRYGLTDVIKLASNENPLGPSPKALAAIAASAAGLNYYPDGPSTGLREVLAERNQMEPDQVIIGNGADGLIQMTCQAYLNPGNEVVTSCSSFPIYDIYTQVMHGRLVKTEVINYGLDLDAMARAVTPRTRIIFVCNPNNPTGTMVTSPAFERFLEQIPPQVLIVSDEAYHEFVDQPNYPDTLALVRAGMPNLLILRTFSKCYGLAGIRLGYAFGNRQALAPLWQVKEPFAVNLLAQRAGLAALEDEEFLQKTIATNQEAREYFYSELDKLGIAYVPTQTNFVLVHLGPRANQIIQRLLTEGIIIRPGAGYDLPEHARISLGTIDQMKRLVTAILNLQSLF